MRKNLFIFNGKQVMNKNSEERYYIRMKFITGIDIIIFTSSISVIVLSTIFPPNDIITVGVWCALFYTLFTSIPIYNSKFSQTIKGVPSKQKRKIYHLAKFVFRLILLTLTASISNLLRETQIHIFSFVVFVAVVSFIIFLLEEFTKITIENESP